MRSVCLTRGLEGIEYYKNLFSSTSYFKTEEETIKSQFDFFKSELNRIQIPTRQ